MPTSTGGSGEDSGKATVIDSATPRGTTDRLVPVPGRVRRMAER